MVVAGANGIIEYSITAGDDEETFSIAENGTIFTNRALDRETKSLYNLVVTATDLAKPPQPRLSATVQVKTIHSNYSLLDMCAYYCKPPSWKQKQILRVKFVNMAKLMKAERVTF